MSETRGIQRHREKAYDISPDEHKEHIPTNRVQLCLPAV